MLTTESIAPIQTAPLRRSDYHRLGELGAFEGKRVQLVFGTVIAMSPMGTPHARAIARLTGFLARTLRSVAMLRSQLPLAASDESEPEPDFALIRPEDDQVEAHPSSALLVIEVADSSLRLDLGPKAALYASIAVPEYWVVDLAGRLTVVPRAPRRGKYSSVRRVPWSKSLTSASVPEVSVVLASLLDT